MISRLRREDGFSMIVVLIALTVASALSIAALAAATGDLPQSRTSQDRKAAYSGAESGIQYFNYQLSVSNTAWKTCGPTGNGRIGPKTVPGTDTTYLIEYLPANGAAACDTNNPEDTMLDDKTGTFQIRSTAHVGKVYRSITATYRRAGFLDYIWFSGWETSDPALAGASADTCAKPRSQRTSSACAKIVFINNDALNGPVHTDDEDFCTTGSPTFGRGSDDNIETTGSRVVANSSGCSGSSTMLGTARPNSSSLGFPDSNSGILTAATANGWVFAGKTTLTLNGGSITAKNAAGTTLTQDANGLSLSAGWPANGVVYIKDGSGGCSVNPMPSTTSYTESAGCANAWVQGTYAKDLTVAAANDVIINGDIVRSGDVVAGLIADRFVRVYHPLSSQSNCGTNGPGTMTNVRIDAAIMSVAHVFIVDNYDQGQRLGTLTVNGAIAQAFRGTVGTSGSCDTGYTKSYTWDDRLHYRNPPYFLDPITAQWGTIKAAEQVPSPKPTGL